MTEILSDVHADAATFGMTAPVGPRSVLQAPDPAARVLVIRYKR